MNGYGSELNPFIIPPLRRSQSFLYQTFAHFTHCRPSGSPDSRFGSWWWFQQTWYFR